MTSRFLHPARNETEETAALFRGFRAAAGRKKDAVSVNNRIIPRFPNFFVLYQAEKVKKTGQAA